MPFYLETERLYLREITPDDAEQAYHLNLDPDVIRYTGDGPFDTVEAAREFLIAYNHYELYGFGRWAVIRKTDEAFLGWCGLKFTPELNEYDIGFRFFKRYWGQGFATEAAVACIATGFQRFNMPVIVGRAMKANTASIRVLQKTGLQYYDDFDFEGEPGEIWRIYNNFI